MKNSALYATGLSIPLCLPGSGSHFTRIEKYRRAIFLLFFLLAVVPVFSQFASWNGSKNSDWFDAANWSGGVVPQANYEIVLPPTPHQPVINAAGAVGTQLQINGGATLTIQAGGTLTLDSRDDIIVQLPVFNNDGTVYNHGTIIINPTEGFIGYEGLSNAGTVINYADGEIRIDRQFLSSISNDATFTNSGSIIIGAMAKPGYSGISNNGFFHNDTGGQIKIDRSTDEGLFNSFDGTFQNNSIITIGGLASPGENGIKNYNAFDNNTSGQIKIDRSTKEGLFNQEGTFQNTALITIGGVASPGDYGLRNFATFNNNTGGQVRIDRSIWAGFLNQTGILNNNSLLIVGGEASPGQSAIESTGEINNNAGGEIKIDRWGSTGLNIDIGTLNNDATIIIGGTAGGGNTALSNGSTINNNACAKIEIYGKLYNAPGFGPGEFSNAGLFIINSTNPHTNNGAVTNNGIIEYRQGAPIPNVTNNDLIINDLSGGCSAYSPALQIGGANSFTPAATWYKDAAQTQVAGTYNLASNTFTPTSLSAGTYPLYFDVTDNANGCTETVTLDYTIANDATPPTVVCKNATVNLSLSGNGNLTTAMVFQSGSDNCGIVNQVSVTPNAFNCSNLGANPVTLTVNDGNGNTATCTATVTIADNTPPTILCTNATVYLDASGLASLNPASILLSGFDNCGTVNPGSVLPSTFTCADIGGLTSVGLLANDGHGNVATCNVFVEVLDNILPTVVCKNATVNLNAAGSATITTATVFQSASDNCGTVNQQSVLPNTFTCANIGANTVTLTVNDGHGKTGTCTATVTVTENSAPTVVCKNTTVNLDASGSAGISTSSVFQSGSDNCGTVNQQSVSPNAFTCSNVGLNTVTLTANDGHGNTGTCTATVTVVDNIVPTVVCKNATVNLDASGSASISTSSVFQSGSDNCGPVNQVSVTPNVFTCAHIGANNVTLTINDGHGNNATCTATVTVTENTPPTVVCKNATVNLDAAGSAGITISSVFQSGSDNCGTVNQVSVSPNSFTCNQIGANAVTLTVNDGHGNTGTCTATVTVVDNITPTVVCKNTALNLGASGSVSLSAATVFQSGTDNCGTVNPGSVSPNTFGCNNLGSNTVTLTVNDGHGNTASCTATVTVADLIAPTMLCKPATLLLNTAGTATLTPAQVNNGSYDNCALVSINLSRTTFTCADIGNSQVFLAGVDGSGNKGVCASTITVEDRTLPVAKCKNITANLNAAGSANPAASAVDNGSSDNCGFSLMLSPATFQCSNVGLNTVTLKVTDNGGNTATCTAVVTVKDVIAPTALCKNPTVYLDDTGYVTISATTVNNGSSDACGIQSMSISNNQFDCSHISGTYPVILTVRDLYNNVSTCTAMVAVRDNGAPTAICENVSVSLNANGLATVSGAALAADSYDNCSVWSYTPQVKTYTAANLGLNNLTITVKDWSGNPSTCTAQVTVLPYNGNMKLIQNYQTPAGPDEQSQELEVESRSQHPSDRILDLALLPNPAIGNVTLQFQLPVDQEFVLRVFDLTGRLGMEREGKGLKGDNVLSLDLLELKAGLYVVELRAGGYRVEKKLVVEAD